MKIAQTFGFILLVFLALGVAWGLSAPAPHSNAAEMIWQNRDVAEEQPAQMRRG